MPPEDPRGDVAPARLHTPLRIALGAFFVAAGVTKVTWTPIAGIPAGVGGFASYLEAAGIPLPSASAVVVCSLEIVCGSGLAVGAWIRRVGKATRWFAGVLSAEMAVAMATVGIPTTLGDPVVLDGAPVTNEPYRLALEVVLFLGCGFFVWKPLKSGAANRTPDAW